LNEDELGTKKNTERFIKIREALEAGQRCLVSALDFTTLTSKQEPAKLAEMKDDSVELR
jgi:hypothetical protein